MCGKIKIKKKEMVASSGDRAYASRGKTADNHYKRIDSNCTDDLNEKQNTIQLLESTISLTWVRTVISHLSLCYWHKSRHKDQGNQIKGPDVGPCNYRGLILVKI